MLELNPAEVEQVLTVDVALEALEGAYRELGQKRAVNRPRTDVYASEAAEGTHYVFKSMEGALPAAGVVALRLNSDFIGWHETAEGIVKDRRPVPSGNVIFLFSTRTGGLVALLPDPSLQKMRVGASGALAARLLARPDASVVGVLGSGGIARTHLLGLKRLLPLRHIKVYSPNPEHRERYAAELSDTVRLPIQVCGTPEEVVRNSDIVVAATSSVTPVVRPEWLAEGAFVSCVKYAELGDAVVGRADRVFVNSRTGAPFNYLVGHGDEPLVAHDPLAALGRGAAQVEQATLDLSAAPTLAELVAGVVPGRQDAAQLTCFVNNIGIGVQFAAIAAAVVERARAAGLGREIEIPWFAT